MHPILDIISALLVVQLPLAASYVIPPTRPGATVQNDPDRAAKGLAHSQRDESTVRTKGGAIFSMAQVKNTGFRNSTGLELMLRTYAKYGAALTPELEHAARVNEHITPLFKRGSVSGTTAASPPSGYDYEYISPVQLGTPPQTVYLDIDTGSADLWVFSSDTPAAQVAGQAIYRPTNSKTAKKLLNYTWKIGYGDGSGASGIVYTDRVAVGNAAFATQAIESATKVSPEFTGDAPSSGILGLGMSAGNTVKPTKQLTLIDNLKATLLAPLFTANLKRGVPGNYNFGYINTFEYTGTIQYIPIDINSIYWQFTPTGFAVGTTPYAVAPWKAIADTGTTLLLLPDNMVKAYYAKVPGSGFDTYWGGITFPCLNLLPDWTFGYGNYRGVVPGRYMNYGHINLTHCYGGIQSSGGIGFSIFGDMVLKAQFVVFDLGNKRLGFAKKILLT